MENVTRNRPLIETEDPHVIARLYELNGYDLQLRRWARDARRTRPPVFTPEHRQADR